MRWKVCEKVWDLRYSYPLLYWDETIIEAANEDEAIKIRLERQVVLGYMKRDFVVVPEGWEVPYYPVNYIQRELF